VYLITKSKSLPGMLFLVVCSVISWPRYYAGAEEQAQPPTLIDVDLFPPDQPFFGPPVQAFANPMGEKINGNIPAATIETSGTATLSVLVHLAPAGNSTQQPPGPARAAVRAIAEKSRAKIKHEYHLLSDVLNIRGLTRQGVEELRRLPGVARIELDSPVQAYLNDSVPMIRASQQQLRDAGLDATGRGVRICIIDTGIDDHSIMYSSRIDKAAGRDFVNDDDDPKDDHGHGSHLAGTVAGGMGVAADFGCEGPESIQGVAPEATLIAVKVLGATASGLASDVIAGIERCASPDLPGGPAQVILLGLGTGRFTDLCDSDPIAMAVNNAANAGLVIVAAGGNQGLPNALPSPACASGAIAVAAVYDSDFPSCEFPDLANFTFCTQRSLGTCSDFCTDSSPRVDQRCCFSNRAAKIEVAAPGCLAFSSNHAAPGGLGIRALCGTSQAAAHVAGLAALLLQTDLSVTAADVRALIRAGAVDLGTPGFDTNFGFGRIDALESLELAAAACFGDARCNDGNFCNGEETCTEGTCVPGDDPCAGQLCRESDDKCVDCLASEGCDDGTYCNGAESCDADGRCQAGADPCPDTLCDEEARACVSGEELFLVFVHSTSVPGVGTVENEDIVAYNLVTGDWALVFDGSDVGLAGFAIDGLARLPNGDLLLSFAGPGSLPGLLGGPDADGTVDDSDIVRFTPVSTGDTTDGSFTFFFDGSDVGLTSEAEDIDAIAVSAEGTLLISTTGSVSAAGADGLGADLLLFRPVNLGAVTAGSFSLFFDGSDVGLENNSREGIDAAAWGRDGTLLFSTIGPVSVAGLNAENEDILQFKPTRLGASTAGTHSLFLDLSALGINPGGDVGAIEFVP